MTVHGVNNFKVIKLEGLQLMQKLIATSRSPQPKQWIRKGQLKTWRFHVLIQN